MRDPAEEDDGERDRRLDEEMRERRWEAFVQVVASFAETEKWSGVMAAVSRAMREHEAEKRS